MSLTLHVSLHTATKKIVVPKSGTVGQLVSLLVEKFGHIPAEYAHARVLHNNKALDNLLPLRFTNLINNSKVSLELGDKSLVAPKPINVKVVVSQPDTSLKTVVLKLENSATVAQLLDQVKEQGAQLSESLVVNTVGGRFGRDDARFNQSLRIVLGDVSSAVVRVEHPKKDEDRDREQREAVRRQQDEYARRQRRLEEERAEKGGTVQPPVLPQQDEEVTNKDEEEPSGPVQEEEAKGELQEQKDINSGFVQDGQIGQPVQAQTGDGVTLFKPSGSRTLYENPDEDYELSVAQAQKYHKLVSQLAMRRPSSTPSPPANYTIRIKFPNQSILQLFFADASVKLGALVKKLDLLVVPKYINHYNLKLGFPPFSTLSLSFDDNARPLSEIPGFSGSKVTLIWELTHFDADLSGPFLVENSIDVKNSEQLPEVHLEGHRAELDDEAPQPLPSRSSTSTGKKVPKWFKTK